MFNMIVRWSDGRRRAACREGSAGHADQPIKGAWIYPF
jgi:hypothetical protein